VPDAIATCAADVATQVSKSLRSLEKKLASGESIYVYAIVVSDDLNSVMACANTKKHYAQSGGGPLDRWYFGQWVTDGMDIDSSGLMKRLGDPTDEEISEPGPHPVQTAWLVALTEALLQVKKRGELVFRGKEVIAFCSGIDTEAARWIELATARLLNSPAQFTSLESELRAAHDEWYGADSGDDVSDLQRSFEKLWKSRSKTS
jgi:hypothetical protein